MFYSGCKGRIKFVNVQAFYTKKCILWRAKACVLLSEIKRRSSVLPDLRLHSRLVIEASDELVWIVFSLGEDSQVTCITDNGIYALIEIPEAARP